LMAALYDRSLAATEAACLRAWRKELLADVAGEVLEVGTGTGLNLAHYPDAVTRLVLAEPDRFMRRRLQERLDMAGNSRTGGEGGIEDEGGIGVARGIEVADAAFEKLPFPDESFDYVVATLVLCSVYDPQASVAEVVRVLKPGGGFVFLEHVAAETKPGRLKWQRRLEPIWKRVMGNCHLTRRSAETIAALGLRLEDPHCESMRKAVPWVRPTIRGVARKPA